MKKILESVSLWVSVFWLAATVATKAMPIVDCTCVANLPELQTNSCVGVVPDLSILATNCFSTNVNTNMPGFCTQTPAAGTLVFPGTYVIQITVTDNQSNSAQCSVPFTVTAPAANLSVVCTSNKTVECGSGWNFDQPVPTTTCCQPSITTTILSTVTNGTCPHIITRTWQFTDFCSNTATCSQTVTEVDTTPPTVQCAGMNLVPNGDFESYTTCPSASSQFDLAAPWFTPSDGTSDYYNSCSGPTSFVSTPTNTAGVQIPRSGQGYGGAIVYTDEGTNGATSYREYLEVPLITPLVAGQTYRVTFYVSLAEVLAGHAIAEIGAYFSAGAIVSNGYYGVFNFVPQVVNPSTNLLTSTTTWMPVTGTFVAAGGEDHLTLGNFLSDPATTAVTAGGPFIHYSYYYFDDVSVEAVCDNTVTNKVVQCGDNWSFDTPAAYDNCSGTNVNVSIASTVTNGICPRVITRTWTLTDLCGNSTNWSQTVTIVDNTPPEILCSGANLVPNPGFESYAYCPDSFSELADAFPWFVPTVGSPDYYNACAPTNTFVSVPSNLFGYQPAFSGQAYAGGYVYGPVGLNTTNQPYREYIEAPLIAPLIAGQAYRVSFHTARGGTCGQAIAEIGAHLSIGPVNTTNVGVGNIPVVPQIVNPSTNVLAATNTWFLIQGVFTAAGGEDHITLGNFRNDGATTAQLVDPTVGFYTNFAYYYYDDVSVVAVCPSEVTNKTVQCGDNWSFDTPTAFDNCSGTNVTVTVSGTVTNGICPRVITRTWTLTDLCGNSTNWSQTVTIVDNTPPMPICSGGYGTNFVPNGDFEFYTACPNNGGQLNLAAPWFVPSDGTSDYFNSCTGNAFVSTPSNGVGSQIPLSGQAYAGIAVYGTDPNIPGSSYREYLEVPLTSPLVANQSYVVSFHVSRAENYATAIAELGAYFSSGPIISNGYDQVFNFTPQVVNPSTNLLIDTTNWMLVQGTFVATGGESYLTLGNFLPDALTTAVPASGLYSNYTYYYYDDVSVQPACGELITEKFVTCGQPWTFDAPAGYDNCSGTNVTVTVASTVTNGVCPQVITRTWTLADACGNTTNWSQTVTVVDNTPPYVLCNVTNLVPNGDFESYTNCPDNLSETEYAFPWFTPTLGTSDYFNSCAGPGGYASVPTNLRGTQTAHSGQGYAGGQVYSVAGFLPTLSYREYIEVPLTAPLVAGKSYEVSFYASLAEASTQAVAEVGAYFSVGPVTNYSIASLLTVTPQVVNPSTNLLSSTNSWMLVQGNFIAAGGEDHLTIGSFLTDSNMTAVPIGPGGAWGAYYYYDDVSVTLACGDSYTNRTVPCGSPITFDPPVGYDDCSGTNVTVSVVGTVTNSVCPLAVTRTWSLTDLCGNSTNWSQTVQVATNNMPVTLNCACLHASAAALLITNGCTGIVPDLSQFTNCYAGGCGTVFSQFPAAGTVVGPGANSITVTVSNCPGGIHECEVPFVVLPPPSEFSCPPNLYLLTCGNSAIANFNPGMAICTPPSGSAFPLGTNVVTVSGSDSCGNPLTCSFDVVVRPVTTRWGCLTFVIAIPYAPMGTAIVVYLPDFPGGGEGVNFDNIGSSGQDGVQLLFGPAQKITFSTVLDFTAPPGAGIDLVVPPPPGSTTGTPLLSLVSGCKGCGWNVALAKLAGADTSVNYRTIAIGTNGELFSSSTHNAVDLATNVIANLQPAGGVTSAVMTVTLDCLTREVSLEFPNCGWTPDAASRGWDGLIYGNGPRGTKTNKTARLVLTPLTGGTPPPITNLYLLASNLSYVAFDNPSITAMGRKWNDGHVTLMKAYDDGTEAGLEFTSLDDGGGVNVDLGHSASFQFSMTHFETGDIPTQEQFSMVGWPPGTTTNRPPPPTNYLRLAPNASGTGGIDCSTEFLQWGVSNVSVELWNGSALVAEQTGVPATLASPVATLNGYPSIIGSPSIGVLSLMDTNPITVYGGLNCSAGCTGTELRIVAEISKGATPPVAWSGLTCAINNGMDDLVYALQTTPAATPVSISATATPEGVTLNWAGDGFLLQGAETLSGPWYDLGVSSPLVLPPNYTLRVFRLISD